MGESLRIQTLGMFRVWLDGTLLPNVVWKREKAQRLLQFLITIRLNDSHQVMPKERIVAELWPTLDEDRADRDFKVALNALNDALEPDRSSRSLSAFITRYGLAYGLNPDGDIEIDAERFRTGLKAAARLEREDVDDAIDGYREAIDELTRAVTLRPNHALAWNARGFSHFMLKEYAEAVEDTSTAIRLNPAYANAYQNRGVARRALKDEAGAQADLEKSRQLLAK